MLFNSADSDSEKYAKMFPDSEIAKMIQFGIAPVIQDTILDELRGQPFCFKFDAHNLKCLLRRVESFITRK